MLRLQMPGGWRLRIAWAVVRRQRAYALRTAATYALLGWLVVAAVLTPNRRIGLQIAVVAVVTVVMAVWQWSSHFSELMEAQRRAYGPIDTERLVLRPPTPADAEALRRTIDDQVIAANGWTPRESQHWDWFVRHSDRFPHLGVYLIAERSTGTVVGQIGMHNFDQATRTCELGWWIGPEGRRRGYATEAVAATIDALHRSFGITRIRIGTNEDNEAVHLILDKVGATLVETKPHTLPNGATVPGRWYVHEQPVTAESPSRPA